MGMEPNQAVHRNRLGPSLDSMQSQFINNYKIGDEITNLSADQDQVFGQLSRQGLQAADQIQSRADHGVFQTLSGTEIASDHVAAVNANALPHGSSPSS